MARNKKKYWHIVGYNSTERIFEDKALLGCYSEGDMVALLRALVSKAGLQFGEIVDAYARRNTRRYRPLLEIQKDARQKSRFVLSCGNNPYFIASVVEE